MLFYCSIDLWVLAIDLVLLMLGDLTSSFFSFSFRYLLHGNNKSKIIFLALSLLWDLPFDF
jgi:hypothetical protein